MMADHSTPAQAEQPAPQLNPALKPLEGLVGDWEMELSHASFLPCPSDTVKGPVSFEWVQDGAFLAMLMGKKAPGPPQALWLIGRDESTPNYTVRASVARASLAARALCAGAHRGRASLHGAQTTLFERNKPQVRSPELAITAEDVAARAAALPSEHISLRFLTPTRLTEHGALVHQPQPGALVRRLAERLDALEHEYAPIQAQESIRAATRPAGRWRAVAEAADLQMTNSEARWVDTKSYSSRQQRALPIGGFVGSATFTGALTPALRELLVWGEIVHVGKNCVKGDGWYQIEA